MDYVRFDSGVEQAPEDEPETLAAIEDAFRKVARLQHDKEGRSMRTSHAKATAIVEGTLTVKDDLPPELAQGLAARGGEYDVLVRFAQGPGEMLPDKISTHRGMAVRIFGVEGASIPEARETGVQDLVLETGPAFIHSTPKTFLTDIKAGVSNAPAMPEGLKSAVSNVARATEAALEAVGGESKLMTFLGHPSVHPLSETYFSQAPMRWGDYVAKVGMFVSDATVAALGEIEIDASDDPDAFRTAMTDAFRRNGASFDLRVQLCSDLERMPVEDASVDWPQEIRPYRTVATLELPAQDSYRADRVEEVDGRTSFRPANSMEAHRPLGGVMRARLFIYERIAAIRLEEAAGKTAVSEGALREGAVTE